LIWRKKSIGCFACFNKKILSFGHAFRILAGAVECIDCQKNPKDENKMLD